MNCATHSNSRGCGRCQFPDSSIGAAAAACETFPPSGVASINPPISCRSDHRRAVCLIFHQFHLGVGPPRAQSAHRDERLRQIHSRVFAVQYETIRPASSQHQPRDEIRLFRIFEALSQLWSTTSKLDGRITGMRCSIIPSDILTLTGPRLAPHGCQYFQQCGFTIPPLAGVGRC